MVIIYQTAAVYFVY